MGVAGLSISPSHRPGDGVPGQGIFLGGVEAWGHVATRLTAPAGLSIPEHAMAAQPRSGYVGSLEIVLARPAWKSSPRFTDL